jgi:hypothetical protein
VSGVLQPERQIVLQGSFILEGIYLNLRTPRGAPKGHEGYTKGHKGFTEKAFSLRVPYSSFVTLCG